jgi:hypothetical protein
VVTVFVFLCSSKSSSSSSSSNLLKDKDFLFDIEDLGEKEKEAADVVVRLLLDDLKIPSSSSRAIMAER